MKVLSLGLGVQSTWLYFASALGFLPRIDVAIFADLGKEKKKTLEYLDWLLKWSESNTDIPIIVVNRKNLYKDLLNSENSTGQRFSSIPAFTKNEDGTNGMLRRQCTNEYKIEQVDQQIRQICGLQRGERMKEQTDVWKGISLDEIERMSIPQIGWKTHVYPFCGYRIPSNGDASKLDWGVGMTRNDILNAFAKYRLPVPSKSSCVFCPYQSDAAWYDMKINSPEDFAAAVQVDEAIRNSTAKGITQPAFLHDSCRPLKEISFVNHANDLWKGECSGECHI